MSDTLIKWKNYCEANGYLPQGASALLNIPYSHYLKLINGQIELDHDLEELMVMKIEHRDMMHSNTLRTTLLREVESLCKEALNEKMWIVAAAPTGQGKTIAAKYNAIQFNSRYYCTLAEMQKEKKAAKRNFLRDISNHFGISDKSVNSERNLVEKLKSDTRTIFIIDESHKLITEDWGYFDILRDIYDNVPNLSVMMIGNFKFYNQMLVSPDKTMSGVADEEQILRRVNKVEKLSRMQANDVKLWLEYNNMNTFKLTEHRMLAEYFGRRAAFDDLEDVRKEMIKNVIGHGVRSRMSDVKYDDFIAVYKKLHSQIKAKHGDENDASQYRSANVA